MFRAHAQGGFEGSVRGPHGVVGKPGGHAAQVAPIQPQISGVIVDHGSRVFPADIEFLAGHTGHRFSGLCRGRPQKGCVDRSEVRVIVGAARAQQQRFDRFEIDLRFNPLALRSTHIRDEFVAAAGICHRLLHVLPVDAVGGQIDREFAFQELHFGPQLVVPNGVGFVQRGIRMVERTS